MSNFRHIDIFSPTLQHQARINFVAYLPYFGTGSNLVASTMIAPTIVAYATIFDAMPRVAWGWAGWQAAKNLSGFQKSARCGCALPVAGYHAQDWLCSQLPTDQYNSILRKNLRILATCVKSATFCIISVMRGQS